MIFLNPQALKLQPSSRGFTLIEMMVVLAVIAILALMALPTTFDSTIRKQIFDAQDDFAKIAKVPIAITWAQTQAWLPDNISAGLPVPEKTVIQTIKSLTIEDGAIHIVFGYQAHGAIKDKTLSLRPAFVKDAPIIPIQWICGNAQALGPVIVHGENKTDIPTRYLPIKCRNSDGK